MDLVSGINDFVNLLNRDKIVFGLIGGLAVFAYGGERTTFDVDFLVSGDDRKKVQKIADELGLQVFFENEEALQLSGPVQIDVLFANRPLSKKMLSRVRFIPAIPFPVVAAEDLVGLKIQAFANDRSREFRDKGDILTIFQNVKDLDFKLIKEYSDLFNLWTEINDLKGRV